MIAKKKFAIVFTVFMLLTSLAIVNVAAPHQSTVTFTVAGGTIPAKPAGSTFWVDILVNASDLTWSPDGIAGWGLVVTVDPTVLKPLSVLGATTGYFLSDYAYYTGIPRINVKNLRTIDNITGLVDITEQIVPTPVNGAATDDPLGPPMPAPYLLVSIEYESLSLYDSTTINITNPEYMDTYGVWHTVIGGDGYYEGLPPVPVGADLVGKKGWAEHHRFKRSKHGNINVTDSHGTPGIQTLYAKIKNTGEIAINVRATFRIMKGGVPEPMILSNEVLLEPGDWVIVQGDAREFLLADDGKWTLEARCEYYFAGTWGPGATSRTTAFVVLP